MKNLKGYRKFVVIIFSIFGASALMGMAIHYNVEGLIGVIGAIGASMSTVLATFMWANKEEHRANGSNNV